MAATRKSRPVDDPISVSVGPHSRRDAWSVARISFPLGDLTCARRVEKALAALGTATPTVSRVPGERSRKERADAA